MLPSVVEGARIFTYDWDARTHTTASGHFFHDDADAFLANVDRKRRECPNRPLIFVASCYGGLILAKALLYAANRHSPYSHVLDATCGIIFLGTPFRGSRGVNAAQTRVMIAKALGHETNQHLLDILERENGILDEIREEFAELALDLHLRQWRGDDLKRIVFCFETEKTFIYKRYLSSGFLKVFSQPLKSWTEIIVS